MILRKARITNFRSIEDSGIFDIGDITCMVGKNEAGKTALLTALAGFEPHSSSPFKYDIERDYPRRHLNDYKHRHPSENAQIVWTQWELGDEELKQIEEVLCEGALSSRLVEGIRRFNDTAPEWTASIDYSKVIESLLAEARLSAPERAQLGKPTNTQELRAAVAKITAPTEKHKSIITRLDKLNGKYILGAVRHVLSSKSPYMMYFSHYDRMVGELRLDNLPQRISGQITPSIQPGEQVFLDFLNFAGTSIEEIKSAQTYESLNARCESASIKITDQLLEYWRQNPYLSIEARVTKGEPNDPAPFNAGIVARARVRNDLYRMSVPFSERSAGFIWFFSFLVKFAQVKRSSSPVLLILDEPGLTLHGTAQGDLLRYFDEKLAPFHQLVFSTHSPFMVPANDLRNIRIVEDKVYQRRPNVWDSEGTKVKEDVLSVDRDTLFPLQGALGYEITQTLFVGVNTLLVEGPSDIIYLQILSEALRTKGRAALDGRWTLCPSGGLDKIQSFISLFTGNRLNIATLTDFAKGDKKKLEAMRARAILESKNFMTFAEIFDCEEADVEDVFDLELYVIMLNGAYSLVGADEISGESLRDADQSTTRIVKKAEAAMRLLPPTVDEFSHFAPANWLLNHTQILAGKEPHVLKTLDRAERIMNRINSILP